MRPEKEYLIRETSDHLEKSTYFFLTDYKGINAEQTSELRAKLSQRGAEFHVVKNSSLKLVAQQKNLPDLSEFLTGHTAIIVGGDDASGVAKDLGSYFRSTEKVKVKGGLLGDRALSADDVQQLSKLPSLDVIRAQLLSLMNTPATHVVSILNRPAQGLLNVLQAKSSKDN
jgi:large subunit ribosomal protein L10